MKTIRQICVLIIGLTLSSLSFASYQDLIDKGKDASQRGQFELAVQYWDKALSELSPEQEPKRYIDTSVRLAAAYQSLGRLQEACDILENALSYADKTKDSVRKANVLMHLSDVYLAMRDMKEGNLDCDRKKNDHKLTPFTPKQLIKKAENSLDSAETELADIDSDKKDYPLLWANIFNRKANLQWLKEKTGLFPNPSNPQALPKYIEYQSKSIESASQVVVVPADIRSQIVQEAGREKTYCGRLIKLASLLELGNRVAVQTDAHILVTKTLLNCLSQNVLLENIDKIIDVGEFSIELQKRDILQKVERLPDSHDKAFALINLAQLMLTISSKIDKKEIRNLNARYVYHALTKALDIAEKLENQRTIAYAQFYLAQFYETFYEQAKRYDKAISLTRQAIFSVPFPSELQGYPEMSYRFNWQLARLLKAQQSVEANQETTPTVAITATNDAYERAENYLQQARRHYGSFSKTFRYEFEQFYKDWADWFLKQAVQENLAEAEKQKLLKQARAKIEMFQAQVVRNYFEDECITEWAEHITDIDGFLKEERHSNTAILYPVLFDDRIELLLSSSKGIHQHVRPFEKSEFEDERGDFLETLGDLLGLVEELTTTHEKVEELRRKNLPYNHILNLGIIENSLTQFLLPLEEIYNRLIKPIEGELDEQNHLIVVPDGTILDHILYKIPFAALYDGDAKKFLIDKYALSVTPGITLTVPPQHISRQNEVRALLAGTRFKEQLGTSSHSNALGFGTKSGTNEYSELSELPCALIEVDEITCILGGFRKDDQVVSDNAKTILLNSKSCTAYEKLKGEDCTLGGKVTALTDENFKRSELKREFLRHYPIVHLTTHGEIGSSQEDTHILVVSKSGETVEKITLAEWGGLLSHNKSKTSGGLELLTLNACDTAVGKGIAVLGLAGVALKTGARNTLGTLWKVRDTAATYTMLQFYQHWWNHPELSKAKALQYALQQLKAEGREYKHPYYWAPFLLTGNGQ